MAHVLPCSNQETGAHREPLHLVLRMAVLPLVAVGTAFVDHIPGLCNWSNPFKTTAKGFYGITMYKEAIMIMNIFKIHET